MPDVEKCAEPSSANAITGSSDFDDNYASASAAAAANVAFPQPSASSHLPPALPSGSRFYPPTVVNDDICLGTRVPSFNPYHPYHEKAPPVASYPPAHFPNTSVMSWVSIGSDGDAATIRSCASGSSSIATGWHMASAPPSSTACAGSSSIAPISTLATLRARKRAGLSVFGAFLALFCTFGLMNSFGTFHAYYSRHQLGHLTPSKISWIGSLQLWVFFFSGGFIGRVFDSYGPTGLMLAGSACYALSMVATAFSMQYLHYMMSQGLFFGLSVGLLFYPSLASVSTHFTKYRATALGIVAAGSSVGGVVYPIILQRLFQSHGFRTGVLICGLASSVACLIAALTVKVAIASPTHVMNGKPKARVQRKLFDLKSITDKRFALLVVGSCFVALGLFTPFFYIVEFAHKLSSKTLEPFNPYYVLAILNAGGIIGRVAPAYLSDTLGHYNLLFPAAFLSGLSCVTLWLCSKSIAVLLGFAAVYGFTSGAFVSLITPCVVQISEGREIGTRIGMLYTVISIPSLVGGPIAGAMLTHERGSYRGMIVFSGATVMLGSLFILVDKFVLDRRVLARV
ncbi:major facilitator superfamily domain-containing protein [Ephemerocybe angulata]|uniref:Major facilitator superfamily domain-containing protein n=1 Tax=Ephemerocybe angulata TaxID=980116 RepID=A0A8H6M8S1_9AGAR|nr:major facilitator superfamily domain-containing protein [Tulosesus angulatus]